MKYLNNFLLILTFSILFSCGDETAINEEHYYVDSEHKMWLSPDTLNTNFVMIDNNEISLSYCLLHTRSDMSKSESKNFGINIKFTYREEISQFYQSTYFQGFSTLISAGIDEENNIGDVITLGLGNTAFSYDFKYKQLTYIHCGNNTISTTYTSEGLKPDKEFYSTIEFIDTMTLQNILYKDIMYFNLNDFNDSIVDLDITDIYIAKNIGLIRYTFKNGLDYQRID
jgi:hypothetical protein